MTKNQTFFLLIFMLTFFSCNDQKYNKNKWVNDDPLFYRARRNMVNDIIDSKMLDNKFTNDVIALIGKPNWTDTTNTGKMKRMNYTVQISYGFDIDPKFCKTLELEVDTINNKIKSIMLNKENDRRSFIEKFLTN